MRAPFIKGLTLFMVILCAAVPFYAAPATAFRNGTENASLGETGASYYSGISSLYYNPANLYHQNISLLNVQSFYNSHDLTRGYSIGYLQWLEAYFALGLNFLIAQPADIVTLDTNTGSLDKTGSVTRILDASISSRVMEQLNYGFNMKIINNSRQDDSYMGMAVDFGLMYKPKQLKDRLHAGLTAMNLYSTAGSLKGEQIKEPFNLKFGLSYFITVKAHQFFITADVNSEKKYCSQYGAGLQYSYKDYFSLSLGHSENSPLTAGLGVNYKFYSFNYSLSSSPKNRQKAVHSVSVTFYFRPKLDDRTKERYYNKAIGYYNDFKFKPSYELFSILYRADRTYRETEYYYEVLKKRLEQQELSGGNRILVAEKQYKEALDLFNKKQYSAARGKLIDCLKNNSKHIEARLLLSKISDIETQEDKLKELKVREKEGDYYVSLSQYASALVEYNEALKLDPENKLLQIKMENAKTELAKENTSALAYKLFDEGKQLFNAGELSKAVSKWEEALIAQPTFTLAKLEIEKARRLQAEQEEVEKMNRMVNDQVTNLFKVARYQAGQGNFVEALFQVESLLEIKPDNAEALGMKRNYLNKIREKQEQDKSRARLQESQHMEQGIAAFKKNSVDEALYHFGKVITLNPQKAGSIREMANILKKISDYESKGLNRDSPVYRLLDSHYRKGLAFYNNKQYDEAQAEWQRALKISPANTLISGQLADAEQKARLEKEERLSKFHLERAMAFLREGKKDLAILEAKRILAILPNNQEAKSIVMQSIEGSDKKSLVESYLEKAADYFADEKYNDAVQELNLVLTIDPGNKLVEKRLMEYKEELNKVEKKNKVANYLKMARSYVENENYSDARRYCNDVLSMDKENQTAWNLLNQIKSKEDNVKITQAEKSRLVDVFNTGLNLFLEGKYDECILNMKKVLILDPENIQALKFIEKARAKISEKEKVAVEPETRVIDKKIVWAHYLKGINHYTTGNLDEAIKEWREALRIDPNNEKIRQSLNKALAKKEMLNKF